MSADRIALHRAAGARPPRRLRLRAPRGPGLRRRRRARGLDRRPPRPRTTLADTVDYGELAAAARRGGRPGSRSICSRRWPSGWPPSACRRAGVRGDRHRAQAAGADPAGVRRRRGHGAPDPPVTPAVLSIGSNLGDRAAHLRIGARHAAAVAARGLAGLRDPAVGTGAAGRLSQRGADGRAMTRRSRDDWLAPGQARPSRPRGERATCAGARAPSTST